MQLKRLSEMGRLISIFMRIFDLNIKNLSVNRKFPKILKYSEKLNAIKWGGIRFSLSTMTYVKHVTCSEAEEMKGAGRLTHQICVE